MSRLNFDIRVWWSRDRPQSLESCTLDFLAVMRLLKSTDTGFDVEYFPADVRPELHPDKRISLKNDECIEFMESKLMKDSLGGDYPELGYSFRLLSDSYILVSLALHIGAYGEYTQNSLAISLPNQSSFGKRVFRAPVLVPLLEGLINIFEPDGADVNCFELIELLDPEDELPRTAGWLTYLPQKQCMGDASKPLEVHKIEGLGKILVTTPQRFNIENKNHLKRLGLAQEYLSRSF